MPLFSGSYIKTLISHYIHPEDKDTTILRNVGNIVTIYNGVASQND